MSLDFNYQSLDIKPTGSLVDIPENKLAKLMYYLDCVLSVIQYAQDTKYTDFHNYYLLTKEDEEVVKNLVILFNPKLMLELKLFIIAPNLIPYGQTNKFYEITDKRLGLHASNNVIIEGKSINVLKIMACKEVWINKYFTEPMDEYIEEYISAAPPAQAQNKKSCKKHGCCKFWGVFGITLCVVLVAFGIFKLIDYFIL